MADAVAAATAAAEQFIAWDVNEETRAQAQDVLAKARTGEPAAVGALLSRFGSRLEFGTAGLRGEMAAGTARMNDLTVLQAAQGLADYVAATHGGSGGGTPPCVVIGYDHRARGAINSRRFAALSAAALTGRGIAVHLFSRLACTPLVPFAVLHLHAAAGVMVTASHNPKADDGYKVYDANGAQIVSPVDKAIAARIGAPENQAPWRHADLLTGAGVAGLATAYALGTDELLARLAAVRGSLLPGYGPGQTPLDDAVTDAYVSAVTASQCRHGAANRGGCPVRVAYTAMHGVGRPFAQAMAASFGLPPYIETPAQVQPDPDFPTVDYPNPEEGKGALALAMATADAAGCSLILANDPDADRLAVAAWVPADPADAGLTRTPGAPGEWRVFTGNEIGALLAAWAWECHVAAGGSGKGAWMAVSAVSSKLVRSMAAAEGFGFREVLTGFKWHGTAMAAAQAAGERVLFSFEEAIGFACGDVVRDKDGVGAAAVFAEMAQHLARTRGLSVAGRLREIYAKYGHFVSANGYVIVDDPSKSAAIFARLRAGGSFVGRLPLPGGRGLAVTGIRDLTATPACPRGWDSAAPGGAPTLPVSSSGNMVTLTFANGAEVTLRTSGTEPKLKWYSELAGPDHAAAQSALEEVVAAVVNEWLRPEEHGIKRPAGIPAPPTKA